jgi:hypothetical protein
MQVNNTNNKNCFSFSQWWLWRMPSSGMWYHVTLGRTNVLEEHIAFIIRVKRFSELWALTVTSNWSMLQRNNGFFLAEWFFSSWWWRRYAPLKCQFSREPHGVTSQKTVFNKNYSSKSSIIFGMDTIIHMYFTHWQ